MLRLDTISDHPARLHALAASLQNFDYSCFFTDAAPAIASVLCSPTAARQEVSHIKYCYVAAANRKNGTCRACRTLCAHTLLLQVP
ncbi:hypothetical protein DXA38_07725 [[Clostridium] innocuum]|uniref:Uncharacterized protein n=1 Tax=Clostridium innocuum TaxID=1522 RepID=A0A3E2VZW5_CLOIN|nr:hypothetical protein DXA38_07725 [[Clostridium] innocuum]RHV68165.1 hypothetical protein DXB22_03770 [Clostridiaceae bacterium OM02-2AC]